MKPFSYSIRDLYLHSSLVWDSQYDDEIPPNITGMELVEYGWKKSFGEGIGTLPEPYDMEKGNLLYVMPQFRYLFISIHDGVFKGAEIRAILDVYYITNEDHSRVRLSFSSRTPLDAINQAKDFVRSNGIEGGWFLWKRPHDKALKEEIIFKENY